MPRPCSLPTHLGQQPAPATEPTRNLERTGHVGGARAREAEHSIRGVLCAARDVADHPGPRLGVAKRVELNRATARIRERGPGVRQSTQYASGGGWRVTGDGWWLIQSAHTLKDESCKGRGSDTRVNLPHRATGGTRAGGRTKVVRCGTVSAPPNTHTHTHRQCIHTHNPRMHPP